MSELTLPKDIAHRPSGLVAMLQHARYVLRDNVVTGFAFGLFVLIVLAALIGPYVVPLDPLASDTAAATNAYAATDEHAIADGYTAADCDANAAADRYADRRANEHADRNPPSAPSSRPAGSVP